MHTHHEVEPSQYSPEQKLVMAILDQAIDDCTRHQVISHHATQRDRDDARAWLSVPPQDHPPLCSAQWCCDQLEMDYAKQQQRWSRLLALHV
jgi:hypothetical protein